MIVLVICAVLLLYGIIQYNYGRKGRGTLVFFFLLTSGFHFLNQSWCPVKYPDFAIVYLMAVAFSMYAKEIRLSSSHKSRYIKLLPSLASI